MPVAAPVHDRVVDRTAHAHGAHRNRRVGDSLGHRHHVRHDAELLGGERRAESAEARDDFVEDEQNAVAVADLAQPLEIALGRNEHARRSGNRLDDDRGDGLGAVLGDHVLERVGEMRAVRGLSARVRIARRIVRVRKMIDCGQRLRRELLAIRFDAADGDAAESDAVIAARSADEANALRLSLRLPVRERDLQCRVDRLGAGVSEEDVIDVTEEASSTSCCASSNASGWPIWKGGA